MTPEQTQAQSDYDAAKRVLAQVKPNDRTAEQQFSLAYKRLVVLGLAMPIKKKYRS